MSTVPLLLYSVISDAATVVERPSKSVLKLFFLEGKLTGVCSLLTSMSNLGSQSVREFCSAIRSERRRTIVAEKRRGSCSFLY